LECLGPTSKNDQKNKEFAFPAYLSKSLNCQTYINNANCGATNEFIFRKTILDLLAFEKQGQDLKDIFVVIGITSLHRTEVDAESIRQLINPHNMKYYQDNDNFPQEIVKYNTLFVNPTSMLSISKNVFSNKIVDTRNIIEFLAKYLWTEQVQLESQEARILALQNFLNFKKINYLFVNTVCPLERTTNLDLTDPHLYKLDLDSFFDFSVINYPDERQPFNHFTRVPHEAYAKILYEYINNVDLQSKYQ
jgi:hypothetical protein